MWFANDSDIDLREKINRWGWLIFLCGLDPCVSRAALAPQTARLANRFEGRE